MLLAIDIGNTNINFGIFRSGRIIKRFFIPTKGYNPRSIKNKLDKADINDVIVCSVVPAATQKLKTALNRLLKKRPIIIGKDIKVPLKNLYRKPREVGQDRLVNAFAGITLYGAPLIAVDFGTAVTFDIVSADKAYLGGMILPGLKVSLDCLAKRTALLPQIRLKKPGEFIGRDTKSSMLSGIVYGFASLTDALVARIKDKTGPRAKVIGTGGDIGLIGRYCKQLDKIDRDLTLKGLNLIYNHR